MATPGSPEPSRSAKAAVEFVVLATTVVAIIGLSLILGGDLQTRILVATVLTLALLVVTFAYIGGFERLSVASRKRRLRWAIEEHPDLTRRLETLAAEAGEIFGGGNAMIYSFLHGANLVNEAARRRQEQVPAEPAGPVGQRPLIPGIERIDEIAQLWSYLAPHWKITNLEIRRICEGPAKTDTQSFVDALVLMASILKMGYWAVYRLLNTAGQINGLTPTRHEQERWAAIRDKMNAIFNNFDALVRETNTAFGTDISTIEEHIGDPW